MTVTTLKANQRRVRALLEAVERLAEAEDRYAETGRSPGSTVAKRRVREAFEDYWAHHGLRPWQDTDR